MMKNPLFTYGSQRARILNFVSSIVLSPFEWMLERTYNDPNAQILFIVGPPRSGTTLLYEMIVTQYSCGYFSNVAKRLFRTPVAATWFYRKRIRSRNGAFDSKWGELEGNAAPSEAGRIWRYWMPYAAPYNHNAPGLTTRQMRKKIGAIGRILGRPMIVKNPILQSDFPQLLRHFPDAIFLHIDRDWADNARSLMRLRDARTGEDKTGWVSLRPKGWQDYASSDALEQSCAQVMLSHRDIEVELEMARMSGRVIDVRYEDLCSAPEASLSAIEEFSASNGVNLVRKGNAASLEALTPRHQDKDETQLKIDACLSSLTSSE